MSSVFFTKGIYASGMVLQRNTTNCIFGKAAANAKVILTFREMQSETTADANGNWKIEYNPKDAGGPFQMKLESAGDTISFDNVYVGEVWVNSGQSNAQLPMERMRFSYPDEFALPENPNVRMTTVPITYNFEGEQDSIQNPTWVCASPSNLGGMSGTAYFFAKKLAQDLQMPVGIVNASQGGSPVEAWMSKKALAELNKDLSQTETYENADNIASKKASVEEAQRKWDENLNANDKGFSEHWEKIPFAKIGSEWTDCTVPGYIEDFDSAGIVWIKKEITLTKEQVQHFNEKKTWLWFGTIIDADRVYVNGTQVGITYYSYPPRRYQVPAGILVEGANTITVRLQKNSKNGRIRLFEEKPYCLFTEDTKVTACVSRNVETHSAAYEKTTDTAEYIPLSGNWKMKPACTCGDAPATFFFEWVPTALYNAMLAPCFNYAVAGALWYQGESNAERYSEYKELLVKMIENWRQKFVYAPKNMPFVVMQLPNWSDGHGEDSAAVYSDWALLREAQAQAVSETANTALSVAIDAGEWNDLHPEKKRTGGTRAAEQALRIAYGKNYKAATEVLEVKNIKDEFLVTFNCKDTSLTALPVEGKACVGQGQSSKGEQMSPDGAAVYGFSYLLEQGGKQTAVEASAELVDGNTVKVHQPEAAVGDGCKILELRYLWAQNPAPVNLYTKEMLPAAPFRVILSK